MTASGLTSEGARRLCAQCGLCCNGVLFHNVRLQPADSAAALGALGLKLKRKKKQHFILQPCPAFRENCCAIYASRPERCRLFECRQLRMLQAGLGSEADALARIRKVQRRVADLSAMLDRAGANDAHRPIEKRCEQILAEPFLADDGDALALREKIAEQMRELDGMLDRDFRLPPAERDLAG